jgi:hypothetical protein
MKSLPERRKRGFLCIGQRVGEIGFLRGRVFCRSVKDEFLISIGVSFGHLFRLVDGSLTKVDLYPEFGPWLSSCSAYFRAANQFDFLNSLIRYNP